MAPPVPGLRPPVQIKHRTAGDVLLAIAAILALAVLVAGVPVALVAVIGLPLPRSVPQVSVLTSQLDITAILRILSVVVWLAWVQLVWCVLVEVKAAISNVGVPSRVPLAGATQSVAHRLVTATLLLFTAAATLSPTLMHSAPPRPAYSVSAQLAPGQQELPPASKHEAVVQTPNADKLYVVKPPVGRYHESLWEIAENHLGDGRRYREIYELNKDRVQPDGTKLTIASLIRPGWILLMPRDARGPGVEAVTEQSAHRLGIPLPEAAAAAVNTAAVHTGADDAGPQVQPTAVRIKGKETVAAPGGQQAQTAAWPYDLASASLLAAGVLSALGRRRREQLWQRAFGRRLAVPDPEAALAERAMRLAANEPAVRMLDAGLRQLARELAAAGKAPPTVFAAHVGADNLDLWIAPPDPAPPQPWHALDGGQVWRLPGAAAAGLDPGPGLAPYPGLVTLGTDAPGGSGEVVSPPGGSGGMGPPGREGASGAGRVMVDLEAANGLIAARGPRQVVQAALAALAVELITNRWSDTMHVTLVGLGDGLRELGSPRLSVVATLDEALPALERRAVELRDAMAAAGIESVLTGRTHSGDADLWAPHYLIMGVPPTQAQVGRLLALARSRYRTAAGYVIAGDVPGATWTWDYGEDGRVQAGVLGFDLAAQLLPATQYAALIRLFGSTSAEAKVSLAGGLAPGEHLSPAANVPVEVTMLGPGAVWAPGPMEPERLGLATEIVMYLAAHPGGVHPTVLTGAIWPRGVSDDVRDAALARVAAWLETAADGRPNLVAAEDGRVRLGPGVRVDWQVFRAYMARASSAAAARDTPSETEFLRQALARVSGQFLDGRAPDRYSWLAADDIEYEVTALVADAAHRLSSLLLEGSDPEGAMTAVRAGLKLAFNDETLWRDLLLGAHATGKEHVLRAVVSELEARVALDDVLPRMAPETEALVDELLPSWRISAA